jgi:hypothetical protein
MSSIGAAPGANALKHGLRAQKFVAVGDENPQAFAALKEASAGELAPEGALQSLLAGRITRAAWRLERAERIEAELFAREMGDRDLSLAVIRDSNGAGAFDPLLRYRGTTLAELWRALRLLKALQPGAAARPHEARKGALVPEPKTHADTAELQLDQGADRTEPCKKPIEPEDRQNPGETHWVASRGRTAGFKPARHRHR